MATFRTNSTRDFPSPSRCVICLNNFYFNVIVAMTTSLVLECSISTALPMQLLISLFIAFVGRVVNSISQR